MKTDKFIQVLNDKCKLEEEINVKNEKIAQLEAEIASLKAAKRHERRVSFSDLDSTFDENDRITFKSTGIDVKSSSVSLSGRRLNSGFEDISIDGQKIMSKSNSSKGITAQDKSDSDMVSLKSIIDSRHRGSWGNNLTTKQKTALYNATAVFLKENNLSVGEKLQQLQMPRSVQETFNDYLDYLVDQDIFAMPRGRSSSENFTEKMLLNACRKFQGSTKKISFEETDDLNCRRTYPVNIISDKITSSKLRNKRQSQEGDDSAKKVVKINKLEPKKRAIKMSERKSAKTVTSRNKSAKNQETIIKKTETVKNRETPAAGSLLSWFPQNSLFSV